MKVKTKSFLSNIVIRLLILVVLLAIICGGVYSALPIIAEKKLPDLFAANGMPFKKFKLKELTTDTMELTNVSDQTGALSINSMKFNYSLAGLYTSNTVRSLEISGITLLGAKRNDGISLGILDKFIRSPVNAKKEKVLTINSLKINNGTFVLKDETPPEKIINEDGEEEEVDKTLRIPFNATGSLSKAGLDLKVLTDYSSPQTSLKTETTLNKTALFSKIKTLITEGDVLKKGEKVGSVTGNLEVAVENGVLSTGTADLLLLSSSQKLKLNASIIPKGSSFDFALDLDRSFDNPKDAVGKFVGLLSLKADDVTMNGTFQEFKGKLPLRVKAPVLTNGEMSVRDLVSEMDVNFSCAGMNCTVNLTKPMTFAFSNLQTTGLLKRITFFVPLELTINPDPKEPFLKLEKNILSFILPVAGFKTQFQLADNQSSSQMMVAINGLKSRIKYDVFSGAYSGDAVFAQSGYADKDIRMTGVQGITSFNSNSLPEARLRIAKAALTKPDVFPEFSADLRLRPQNRYDFGIDSSLQIQNGLVSVSINGSYSLPTREYDFYVVVPKFTLSETGAKLSTVMPFMLKHLPDETIGSFAVKGRIAAKGDYIQGPLNILIEKADTAWKNVRFSNINGILVLSSLSPLGTPTNQQLFTGVLNTGIPFQNALFNFQIQPNKGIEVANARMKYADGQFKTIKSFLIPFDGKPSRIILEGNGINLSMITNNLKSSALQMDGILNSEWNLSLTETGELMIDQAVFSTKMPGTLHFNPPEDLQKSMNPQMQSFLKDVIVKGLKLTAKGQMDGEVSFDVSITGHSPLDESGNDQDVSFDFKSGFRNLLKQEGNGLTEMPPDVLQMMQNYSR